MKLVCKVEVVESERGWGSRVDDYVVCLTLQDAEQFKKNLTLKMIKNLHPIGT